MRLTLRTRTQRASCALLLLVAVNAAAQTQAPPAKPDPAAVVGNWEGTYHDAPAITLRVKLDGERLSGTVVFYRIIEDSRGARADGQAEVPMLEPKFDGAVLSFKIKPPAEEAKPFDMELKLTGPDEGLAVTKRGEEDGSLTTLKVVRKK
ncbi:MAG TPA: hypothetical protein VF546_06540 [Pyrinomonadaceae bacterium]|jgi:hypothetical protein